LVTDRSYEGPDDVARLQRFTSACIAAAGHSGYLHPGEVPHWMFNGQRNEDLTRLVRIWEAEGEIVAWVLVSPRHAGFEAQVAPQVRIERPSLERNALLWGEMRTRAVLAERGATTGGMVVDAFEDDAVRTRHLVDLGWRPGDESLVLTMASLAGAPMVEPPDGYVIRTVAGVEEAEAVAAVHSAAFGSVWLPGQYRAAMESPGYDPGRELVAVAPDGTFAGFAVMWHDHTNGIGLFEPVGVHPAHRRIGLGRAVLAAGLAHMRRSGMTTASVMYEPANPASGPLYRSLGFVDTWTLFHYRKPLSPGS